MGKITSILQVAQQRAKEMNASYEGALFPNEAYELLQAAPYAKLVDVRTRAELDWVGRIPEAVEIEWMTYPGMKPNPHFVAALEQQVDKESLVLFICRSGARSHAATLAATASPSQSRSLSWSPAAATGSAANTSTVTLSQTRTRTPSGSASATAIAA